MRCVGYRINGMLTHIPDRDKIKMKDNKEKGICGEPWLPMTGKTHSIFLKSYHEDNDVHSTVRFIREKMCLSD